MWTRSWAMGGHGSGRGLLVSLLRKLSINPSFLIKIYNHISMPLMALPFDVSPTEGSQLQHSEYRPTRNLFKRRHSCDERRGRWRIDNVALRIFGSTSQRQQRHVVDLACTPRC